MIYEDGTLNDINMRIRVGIKDQKFMFVEWTRKCFKRQKIWNIRARKLTGIYSIHNFSCSPSLSTHFWYSEYCLIFLYSPSPEFNFKIKRQYENKKWNQLSQCLVQDFLCYLFDEVWSAFYHWLQKYVEINDALNR